MHRRLSRASRVAVGHCCTPAPRCATMAIHDRTARRVLQTLEDEGYLQRGQGNYRQRHTFRSTGSPEPTRAWLTRHRHGRWTLTWPIGRRYCVIAHWV